MHPYSEYYTSPFINIPGIRPLTLEHFIIEFSFSIFTFAVIKILEYLILLDHIASILTLIFTFIFGLVRLNKV